MLSPFQHPHLVEFTKSLPERLLRANTDGTGSKTGKRLLMQSADQCHLLPAKVIYQRKASPVAGMADYWYMYELRPFMLEGIKSLPFEFDMPFVSRMLSFNIFEELFRKKISLGDYVFTAPSLLFTYASFNRPDRGIGPPQ